VDKRWKELMKAINSGVDGLELTVSILLTTGEKCQTLCIKKFKHAFSHFIST